MRNQVFKKLFSVLLALIMVAGLLPASVLAEGEGNADSTPAPTEAVQPTESAEPTAPTETETPEVTEVPAPTPENPATTVEPTQGEPTAEPTDEGIMPANVMPVQANVELQYRIVHLDCGREYFTKDWIIALINEMAEAGYNQLQLAFGNGGFRFYLNNMAVGSYSHEQVMGALEAGNKHYNIYGDGENGPTNSEWITYNPSVNALTQTEMDTIIKHAQSKGIEIVPMLNTPGHMHAVLTAMSELGISGNLQVSDKPGCLNLSNTEAVAFTKALVEKYVDYFALQGCKFFNLAMDEYSSFNDTFFTYANELIGYVSGAVMTPRVFNDALSKGKFTSGTQICYWYSQDTSASSIANMGYSVINTNHDYYYVSTNEYWNLYREGYTFVGNYDESEWVKKAKQFNNTTFYNGTYNNPVGSMFCIWCNTPGKNTETQIAQQIRMILRVIGARMQNSDIYSASNELVEGGFKADGTINVPTNTTTVGNATTADRDTVRVTGPNLAALTAPEHTGVIAGIKAVDGIIKAYDVTPSTADSNYTEKAEVRIKIPEGWDSSKVIAFIVGNDGTVKDINGMATEDGWYVFTAPHFSVMGIYEKAATTEVGGTIEIAKGSTGVITVPGDVTNSVGEIADKTVAEKVEVKPVQQTGETISYSATASASIPEHNDPYWPYTSYSASNLIDGDKNTYYWSSKARTVGAYAQVDLGAAIPFDAVRIIPTNHDDAACTADVKVSADGSTWTKIGSYDGTKTTILNNTVGNVRYIRVEITVAKTNWWQLAEIQWGSYANGTFTRMAASGSVTTEGKTETQVTIKGIAGGETTIEIDGKTYTIKVVDATLAQQVLPINLWITNTGVVPTNWSNGTPAEFTYSDDGGNRRSIYTLKASHSTVNSPNGISLSSILPQVTGTAKSWDNNTYNVTYWKSAYHTAENRQSTDGWTNYSHKGTKFEYIRFYEGSWAYSVDGITWVNIKNVGAEATDTDKNQVCIWYRQVTTVTSEVTTEIVDWGPIDYEANQCLLDFAVKYDGTENRIPNSFPVTGKTMGFACPTDQTVPLGNGYVVKDTDGTYYRTVYGIAGVETLNYEVYMITVTPTSDTHTDYVTKGTKPTELNYGGTEKIAWAKTEADANSTELNKMPNVKYGGEPFLESVKIYQYQGLLVTYYLRAKQTPDSLTVHYAIQGSETAFYEYNIAVNQGTTFDSGIALDPQDDDTVGGPLLNGEVINSNNETITVSSELATLQGLEPQYRYSKYKIVDFRKDDKNVWIYYTFTREHTYVIDFGLPLKIKFSDFGVTNDADIKTVSLWEKEIVHENKGLYGTANVITGSTEGKYVLYTLDKPLDKNITIPLYVKFNQRGDNDKPQLFTANIIPATNVYYEDSFAKFTDGSGTAKDAKWTIVKNDGGPLNEQQQKDSYTNQALEALGEKTNHKVYGYDPAYDKCTMFSMGSAQKVTVTSDMATNWNNDTSAWPTAQFTFKGTGFDIISLTNNTSGAIFVDVYNVKTSNKEKSVFVDNYYGYTYNSETNTWDATPEKANALYQIPVIALRNLPYAEYNVVIKVAYSEYFDHTAEPQGSYSFWLDAVRVYDPAGTDLDNEYVKDKEGFPQYIKLRDAVANKDAALDGKKALFIDGGNTADIAIYANIGPNNEVYLANGQAITFKLNVGNANIETIQIGAKAPMSEGTAKLNVNNAEVVENGLSTATEMYYNIKDKMGANNTFTISNTGSGILSLTNLKITFNAKGSVSLGAMNAEEQTASVMAVRALFAPAPVEPEPEPEPEKTFEPDRFEASWSRNVMQGRKATLTVKTSEDVEAITVDGQTIRSYRTRTERMGFGRRAKRITYREFTYSMVAQESADFSVTAINAEGTESEAITARLTVKTRPNSLRDMWDWFKGWF